MHIILKLFPQFWRKKTQENCSSWAFLLIWQFIFSAYSPRIGRYAKISAESREAYRACSLALLLVVQLQCPVQHLVCPLVVVWPELRLHSVSNAGQGLLETAV